MLHLSAILQHTIDTARSTGALLREGFALARAGQLDVQLKGRFDPLTEYDQRAEAMITLALRAAYPDFGIIGEEGAATRPDARFVWHIDPIDGTHNFSHGVPWFSTSIGLVDNGHPIVGVVFDPVNDRLFAAAQGLGATRNRAPIRVSRTRTLDRALLGTGFPTDRSPERDNNFRHFLDAMRVCQDVRRMGSAALDLCMTACGEFDAFWQPQLHSYDIAAGIVIVREAGGCVTDFAGGESMLTGGDIVASNAILHPALMDIIARDARLDADFAP
jgi:myo-inositol-1(or 4)-monophosphatase